MVPSHQHRKRAAIGAAQELRNAIYSGTWLTSAKEYFSKPNSGGKKIGDKYLTADWNRQGGLEVALKWVSHDDIIGYMSEHAGTEEDGTPLYENAEDLYNKFEEIIKWVKRVFPNYRKEMKKADWGSLYDKYGSKFQKKDAERLEKLVSKYMADEDVTKKPGIYGYVLGEPEKVLSIRKFNDRQKREAYERQEGKCPRCQAEGNDQVYDIGEMEADHIAPWSQGGATVSENCMMLCKDHNGVKSDAKGKGGKKAIKEEERHIETARMIHPKGKPAYPLLFTFSETRFDDVWARDEYLQFMYERLILIPRWVRRQGDKALW